MAENFGHLPVLGDEVLEYLAPEKGQCIADLTLGAGGHAELILERLGPTGTLVGFDRDDEALNIATERLARFGACLEPIRANFADAPSLLNKDNYRTFDGVLADLGVSSMQLDNAERGFSFQQDGPLDMRMSTSVKYSAKDFIARASEEELVRVFRDYGEEPRAFAIAKKIVEVRKRTQLKRTSELAELVRSVTGSRGKIHPATRVFQAVRIEVNGELAAVEAVLPAMIDRLNPGGRIVIISFHSLEDRIVKNCFRAAAKAGRGVILTKKPVMAREEESRQNPRSRSAKLRCFERPKQDESA